MDSLLCALYGHVKDTEPVEARLRARGWTEEALDEIEVVYRLVGADGRPTTSRAISSRLPMTDSHSSPSKLCMYGLPEMNPARRTNVIPMSCSTVHAGDLETLLATIGLQESHRFARIGRVYRRRGVVVRIYQISPSDSNARISPEHRIVEGISECSRSEDVPECEKRLIDLRNDLSDLVSLDQLDSRVFAA